MITYAKNSKSCLVYYEHELCHVFFDTINNTSDQNFYLRLDVSLRSVFLKNNNRRREYLFQIVLLGVQVCQEKCREKSVKIGNFSGS